MADLTMFKKLSIEQQKSIAIKNGFIKELMENDEDFKGMTESEVLDALYN